MLRLALYSSTPVQKTVLWPSKQDKLAWHNNENCPQYEIL
jgi:hypothetical protein